MLGASRKTTKIPEKTETRKEPRDKFRKKKNLWQTSQEELHEKYQQKLLQKPRRNLGRNLWRITEKKTRAEIQGGTLEKSEPESNFIRQKWSKMCRLEEPCIRSLRIFNGKGLDSSALHDCSKSSCLQFRKCFYSYQQCNKLCGLYF